METGWIVTPASNASWRPTMNAENTRNAPPARGKFAPPPNNDRTRALTQAAAFCSNRQMPEPEVRAVADNLLQALRFFGHARASSEIQDLPGVSLIFCGLNYAAFNAALVAQPVEGDGQVLGAG